MQDVISLDHAASTPIRPEVLALYGEVAGALTGNPMSGHAHGRAARTVLEEARERTAAALARSPHEIVFTSGATEADQLAVVGYARAAAAAGRRHVVSSAVEHAAVRDAVTWVADREDLDVTLVEPAEPGPLDGDAIAAALREDTGLVVVTAAEGEVGIVQDAAVADAALARGIPVLRDAAQAVATGVVPDRGALAVSGHKIGAPAGIGVAVLPRSWPVEPVVAGPGQERGLRSGTPAAALAAALALALERTLEEAPAHRRRCRELARLLVEGLVGVAGLAVTPPDVDATGRLASHVHLTVDGVDGEALATALDAVGVAVSTGSACATGSSRPSPVLAACGLEADAAIRVSFGRTTTADEVGAAAGRIRTTITRLRAEGGGFL